MGYYILYIHGFMDTISYKYVFTYFTCITIDIFFYYIVRLLYMKRKFGYLFQIYLLNHQLISVDFFGEF